VKAVNLELRVEELMLDGFAPTDRYRIGEAVERELARLFTERGVSPTLNQESETEYLDGGAFELKPNLGAEAIGVQVAQTVYVRLNR
jgi:hypothetical protein